MNLHQLGRAVLVIGRKSMPLILMATGTIFSIDAIVMTPGASDESRKLEDEAINEKIKEYEVTHHTKVDPQEVVDGEWDLTILEKIDACWPAWVPVAWREALALVCFFAAFGIKDKRGAALAAAYALLERERDDLDAIVREKLTPDQYESHRHELMNKDIQQAITRGVANEIVVGSDDALGVYYEPKTGKMFKADPRDIKRVMNELNDKYLVDGFVSLSDFFTRLKINPPEVASYIGWSYEPGYGSIKYKTYDYYWQDKDIFITGLDMGIRLDEFVKTWY